MVPRWKSDAECGAGESRNPRTATWVGGVPGRPGPVDRHAADIDLPDGADDVLARTELDAADIEVSETTRFEDRSDRGAERARTPEVAEAIQIRVGRRENGGLQGDLGRRRWVREAAGENNNQRVCCNAGMDGRRHVA